MRPVFEILPSSFDAENCTLLCEVGNEGFSYCIKDESANSFLGLAIYHYDKNKPPVGYPIALQIIFHQKEILSKKFKKVFVVYSLPQSVLIPFSLYNREDNSILMNMMHGDLHANETILTDVITSHSIYNCYRIPSAVYETVQNQYPDVVSMHQYSLLMKSSIVKDDKLSVIFYTQKIIVSLIKDGKYQLVNSFNYRTTEDVSYILLNICHQFEISKIPLAISGLLEENSALYKEMYKFFTEIELAKLPGDFNYSEEILQHPSHYFSSIFELVSCA